MGMREKLIELLTDAMPSCYSDTFASQIAVHLIANGVTIPVRCKDCKEWLRNRGVVDSPNGHCFYHETHMNGYDFCSYGERRTNENDR